MTGPIELDGFLAGTGVVALAIGFAPVLSLVPGRRPSSRCRRSRARSRADDKT